jgi:hypothetical protein
MAIVTDKMVHAAMVEAERQNALLSYRLIRKLLEAAVYAEDNEANAAAVEASWSGHYGL